MLNNVSKFFVKDFIDNSLIKLFKIFNDLFTVLDLTSTVIQLKKSFDVFLHQVLDVQR